MLTANERAARYRARKRGEAVPVLPRGPKPGFKQPPEQIEKRKRWGPDHHAWKGDSVDDQTGRKRARHRFDALVCTECGSDRRVERHHKDGNTKNNVPDNIAILCRRCHMVADGRLEKFKENRYQK